MMPTIRVDDQVWDWLKSQARPFEDTPNSVLRRVAGLEGSPTADSRIRESSAPIRRRERGEKTPQDAYRTPILRILLRHRGRADRAQVLRELEHDLRNVLTDFDRRDIKSGTIRWQKSAEWEVSVMRQQGILLSQADSPRGVWCLSPLGEKAARAIESKES